MTTQKSSPLAIVALALLPLIIIGVQLGLKLEGVAGYSLYKLAFIVPPLLYCYYAKISLLGHIWRFNNWRNGLKQSFLLGIVCMVLFWLLYTVLSPFLIDTTVIVANMKSQFSVSLATVFLVAPVTIVLNSFIEESFYRGFVFGQLQGYSLRLAYWLSAILFTIQHLLFTYHWVGPEVLLFGIVGLLFFALIAASLYRKHHTIVAPWVLHICGDITMMAIAVWLLLN